jgi:pre-mRNA-splicing factor ATP-dependent RNA helicase DHX16
VKELYSRAPRKSKKHHSSGESSRKHEKDSKALRSQQFVLLPEDDDNSVEVVKKKKKSKDKEKEKGKGMEDRSAKRDRQLRKREYGEDEWASDEEEKARKRRRAEEEPMDREEEGRRPPDDDMDAGMDGLEKGEDEDVRREREREEDLKERDEFAKRMQERDKQKTKKIVEDRSSKNPAASDAAVRRQLADDPNARDAVLPDLRLRSRQEYLTKREIQQIELLRKEIQDEEALFHGMKVSRREQHELDRKKQILKLAEERLKINDHYEGYQLPEDYITEQGKIDRKKKENVLYKRYDEAKPKEGDFTTDIDQWEAAQTKNSTFKTGALDKPEVVDNYDYVFDESQTIQFVMDNTLPGAKMSAADKLLQQQIEEAEKRGEPMLLGIAILFIDAST